MDLVAGSLEGFLTSYWRSGLLKRYAVSEQTKHVGEELLCEHVLQNDLATTNTLASEYETRAKMGEYLRLICSLGVR